MKICSTCHTEKSESEFYSHPHTFDGLLSQCKWCIADRGREYRKTARAKELSKLKVIKLKERVKNDPVFAEKFREMKRISMRKWYSKNKQRINKYHQDWSSKRKSIRQSSRPPKPTCKECGNTDNFRLFKGAWVCRVCSKKARKSKDREWKRISQIKKRAARLQTTYGTRAATCYLNYASTHKGCGALGPLRIHTLCLPTDWQKSPPTTLERIYLLNRILKLPFGNIGWTCQKCPTSCSEPRFFDIDHVHPKHKGGHGRIENLQVLCPNCHRKKTVFDVFSKSVQLELKTFGI